MEEEKISKMRSILGDGRAHYMPLIEQLIFMEETHGWPGKIEPDLITADLGFLLDRRLLGRNYGFSMILKLMTLICRKTDRRTGQDKTGKEKSKVVNSAFPIFPRELKLKISILWNLPRFFILDFWSFISIKIFFICLVS